MKRTLYLVENKERIVVQRDGPSFLITLKNKAPRRVPVRLIDKVVVVGNIRLDSETITLCAEHQIPVLFIDKTNNEKAILLPYNHKLPKYYKAQRVMLQSNETLRRYKKWIKTRITIARVETLKALFKAFNISYDIGEGNYEFIINKIRENKPGWSLIKDIVMNFIRAVIAGRIIKAGLDLHLGLIHRRVNFGLVLDISLIFDPEADFQTFKFYKSYSNEVLTNEELTPLGIKGIIDRFESRRQYIAATTEKIIDELFEIMRDVRI